MTAFDLDAAIAGLLEREEPRALDLGCGEGGLARSLAAQGFRCTAVDRAAPAAPLAGVDFVRADLRAFDPGVAAYDLVVARHVLQFFREAERRDLLRRALGALREGGLLLLEAFTVADPSYGVAQRRAFPEVEPRTFVDPETGEVMAFFAPEGLRAWAASEGAAVLHYEEKQIDDAHAPLGRHVHGVAFLAARRQDRRMDALITHYREAARYNRWMNDKLYALAASLTDEERKRPLGAFFGSIHLTLNHILRADRIWLSRLGGAPALTPSPLPHELYAEFAELRAERAKTDDAITAYCASLEPTALDATLAYTTARGPASHPAWMAVSHFFNHQTHHRGQITTLFSQLGKDPGVTDWLALLLENPAT